MHELCHAVVKDWRLGTELPKGYERSQGWYTWYMIKERVHGDEDDEDGIGRVKEVSDSKLE